MATAACSIITKSHLPYARVLMESVRKWNPGLLRIVVIVDRIDDYFDPYQEEFEVVTTEGIDIPQREWFHFKYTVVELCAAIRPFVLQHLLRQYGLEKILFIDADIAVYGSLDPLLGKLDEHPMLLTPHITRPIKDGWKPRELEVLRTGAYNTGFVAFSNSAEAHRILDWWQKKLYDQAYLDLPNGMYLDQGWMALAPSIFPETGVVRDPGCNVAYWNLSSRKVKQRDGRYFVNGGPLRFFHFSGFNPRKLDVISKYLGPGDAADSGPVAELAREYGNQVLAAGYEECQAWEYTFSRFENGVFIPDLGRPLHRVAPEIADRISNPFSDAGYEAFVDYWNGPVKDDEEGRRSGITRLAHRVYQSRPDLQARLPAIFGADRIRYLRWLQTTAKSEHAFLDVFQGPVIEALTEAGQLNNGDSRPPWRRLFGPEQDCSPELLNAFVGRSSDTLKLTRLARKIYDSRSDLRRRYPDPYNADWRGFVSWFLHEGREEYELADELVSPIERQWDEFCGPNGGSGGRIRKAVRQAVNRSRNLFF